MCARRGRSLAFIAPHNRNHCVRSKLFGHHHAYFEPTALYPFQNIDVPETGILLLCMVSVFGGGVQVRLSVAVTVADSLPRGGVFLPSPAFLRLAQTDLNLNISSYSPTLHSHFSIGVPVQSSLKNKTIGGVLSTRTVVVGRGRARGQRSLLPHAHAPKKTKTGGGLSSLPQHSVAPHHFPVEVIALRTEGQSTFSAAVTAQHRCQAALSLPSFCRERESPPPQTERNQ